MCERLAVVCDPEDGAHRDLTARSLPEIQLGLYRYACQRRRTGKCWITVVDAKRHFLWGQADWLVKPLVALWRVPS